jgi:hypothetical protein
LQTLESIESRVGDRGFWLQTSCALVARPNARPNGSKEGLGTLGGRDRIAHELGRARNQGQATESWKRAQREEGGAEGGRAVFIIVVEKAARPVHTHVP